MTITNLTHGGSRTKLYRVWQGIHQRCSNPADPRYAHYGAKGVVVCPQWSSFPTFRDWALAQGYYEPQGERRALRLSLDRIDVDGPYAPENCEWVPLWENTRRQKGLKLAPDDVRAIRCRLAAGETQQSIADSFSVSKAAVQKINVGRSWAHLD